MSQFLFKAHKPLQVFELGGAQRPDLSRLLEGSWCLLCSVPPHCAVAILFQTFSTCHTYQSYHYLQYKVYITLFYLMGNSLESFFKHSLSESSTAQFFSSTCHFCFVHCEYLFCYFCIPERRLYLNSVRMCVQTKIRATYTLYDSLEIYL